MKIHFDNVNFAANTGPNVFATRLAKQFIVMGHSIADTGTNADVSLVFIEPSGKSLATKIVQRLDGIWTHPDQFIERNKSLRELYEKTDAVVFQSNFDKKFIEHHWGERNFATICNGISINPVTKFASPALEQIRSEYDYVFVSSANWHAQKRLKANTELFFFIRNGLNKRCCYIVMGNNPDHLVADNDVFYTGSVPENVYMEVYSLADWMLHLAWRDHCPNTVLECLSQQTPVICSSDSGVPEIIGSFGIQLSEDTPNDLSLFDFDKPPAIDYKQLSLPLTKPQACQIPDVSIETCALSYVNLFRGL